MRSGRYGTAGPPKTPNLAPRKSQKATLSFPQVLASPRKASRQSRPMSLLLELVDEIDQIEEAPPGTGADDGRRNSNAEMRFAGAGATDEDGIALGVEEGAGGELAHLALIHRCIGKDALDEVFENREPCSAETITDRTGLAVRVLGADQTGNERIDLIAPCQAFAGDLIEAGAHTIELEPAHGLEDFMTFHQATFLMLS